MLTDLRYLRCTHSLHRQILRATSDQEDFTGSHPDPGPVGVRPTTHRRGSAPAQCMELEEAVGVW